MSISTFSRRLAAFVAVTACGCSLLTDFDALEGNGASDAGDAEVPRAEASTDATTPPVDASSGGSTSSSGSVPDASEGGLPTLPYRAAVLADSPIAYWPLDEAAGSPTIHDAVGDHDGDIQGVMQLGVPGVSGTALQVDDPDAKIFLGNTFDLVGDWAIELWARPALAADFTNVLWNRNGANIGWVVYFGSDGHLQFEQYWNDSGTDGRVGFSQGAHAYPTLQQVVISYEASKGLSMYLDGVKLTEVFLDGDQTVAPLGADLYLSVGYTGAIDEVSIYDKGLSADRVAAHRAAASPP